MPTLHPPHGVCGLAAALLMVASQALPARPAPTPTPSAETLLATLRQSAKEDPSAWPRLVELCDTVGPRLAGSLAFTRAVAWARAMLAADGHEAVRLEPVTVRAWVRGRERAEMTAPIRRDLPMLGLGGSVGTPGIEAPVTVVRSVEELGPRVNGTIVLFCPEILGSDSAGARYGTFSHLRTVGASAAAGHGAVAALVRSAPLQSLATPHTGHMAYDEGKPRIPAAALSAEDAEWISRLVGRGIEVRIRLEMEAHDGGPVQTANVIAEIRGSEKPEEIVLVGGHLDSWDVGQGAQDDGVGVVHTVETLRLIRALGVQPRRTIRGVLFANEENGLDGGTAYATAHGAERHVAAVESDLGAGAILHWAVVATPQQAGWLLPVVKPVGIPVEIGGAGADISGLTDAGVLGIGGHGDVARYFDVHHTHADTPDKVDPQALRDGLANVAALVWLLANAPAP